MKHGACGPSVPLELERVPIIRTRLSGNDVNHALHLLEFGLPYVKKHFDSVVPMSRNFKKDARWTELNRTQAKMPDVLFVMGFNVAFLIVWVFEIGAESVNKRCRGHPRRPHRWLDLYFRTQPGSNDHSPMRRRTWLASA